VRTWHDIAAGETIDIALTPRSALPPVLCGVEIIENVR
jgi:hypothetical protein